jgi:hypothetical protein
VKPILRSLSILCLVMASAASYANEPTFNLVVQDRDTLIGLTEKLLISPAARTELARLNKLGNQDRLSPGQVLVVPVRLLRGTQSPLAVTQVNGPVTIDGKPAAVGMKVNEGANITSGAGATLTLAREDGTKALVMPNSKLEIKENRALAKNDKAGFFRSLMRIATGAVEMEVVPAAIPDHVTVKTPTSIVGVRGTSYRVGADDAGSKPSSRVEVLRGAVQASGDSGGGVALAGGFGTKVVQGEAPLAPRKLLDAPRLALPAELAEQMQRFAIAPVEGAAAYDVSVSPANDPQVLLSSQRVSGTQAEFPDLPNGEYSVRVRAIDSVGLQGLDAKSAVRLAVSDLAFDLKSTRSDVTGTQNLAWRFGRNLAAAEFWVQVADSQDFSSLIVDGRVRGAAAAVAKDLQAGVYYWRVGTPNGSGGWRFSRTASFNMQ